MPSNRRQIQYTVQEVDNNPPTKRLKSDSACSSPKSGCSYSDVEKKDPEFSGDQIVSDVQNMPGSFNEAQSPVQSFNFRSHQR